MAVTLDTIKQYCDTMELKYQERGDTSLVLIFGSKLPDGEPVNIPMAIHLLEDGELFMLESLLMEPGELKAHENREAFLMTLLHAAWQTPFGSVEMDTDGDLRLRVEIPLEDNTLTLKQFARVTMSSVTMTGLLKELAKGAFGPSESKAGIAPEKLKEIVEAAATAATVLQDPSRSAAEKQAARNTLAQLKATLPEPLWQAISSGISQVDRAIAGRVDSEENVMI